MLDPKLLESHLSTNKSASENSISPSLSCQELKGIGKSKYALLQERGIVTVADMLLHNPREIIAPWSVSNLNRCSAGERVTVLCQLGEARGSIIPGRRLFCVRVRLSDSTGVGQGEWFLSFRKRPPYWCVSRLKFGQTILIQGKVRLVKNGVPTISVMRYMLLNESAESEVLRDTTSDIPKKEQPSRAYGLYRLPKGIHQSEFRKWINAVLDRLDPTIDDGLGVWAGLDFGRALLNLHNPESAEAFAQAKRRIVAGELAAFAELMVLRRDARRSMAAPVLNDLRGISDRLISTLPFDLTESQSNAWREISADLASGSPMDRLLQGDVGSGKTVISALTGAYAAGSGYQAAILVPTDILAKQQHATISSWLTPLGVKVSVLTASLGASEKATLKTEISKGKTDVVIGTHSLLSEDLVFKKLAVVITDEQHRFGTEQRDMLARKGEVVHTLMMSATPIPRTLALSAYGDLDMSVLSDKPPGRKPVVTKWVPYADLEKVDSLIIRALEAGGRVYVVCPRIDSEQDEDNWDSDWEQTNSRDKASREQPDISVIGQQKRLSADLRSDSHTWPVGIVHGGMSAADRQSAMEQFLSGEVPVLVSTTVIEVGVDVPDANLMVIIGADRFGISQLHQLRGRIGRGSKPSLCILISDSDNDVSKARLDILRSSDDGFFLADQDLELRGTGELLGKRQHGLTGLVYSEFPRDLGILADVREAVGFLMANCVASKDLSEILRRVESAAAWYPIAKVLYNDDEMGSTKVDRFSESYCR